MKEEATGRQQEEEKTKKQKTTERLIYPGILTTTDKTAALIKQDGKTLMRVQ